MFPQGLKPPSIITNLLEKQLPEQSEQFGFLSAQQLDVLGDQLEGHVFFDLDARTRNVR